MLRNNPKHFSPGIKWSICIFLSSWVSTTTLPCDDDYDLQYCYWNYNSNNGKALVLPFRMLPFHWLTELCHFNLRNQQERSNGNKDQSTVWMDRSVCSSGADKYVSIYCWSAFTGVEIEIRMHRLPLHCYCLAAVVVATQGRRQGPL